MDWTIAIVAAVGVITFILIKRMSYVSEKTAHQHLANGALVIDVRSPEEFRSGNVPGAINIPLNQLSTSLPSRVKDKTTVLLVHCLSGGRSGMAQQQLKQMGYQNVFNLGSLGRAKEIVGTGRNSRP